MSLRSDDWQEFSNDMHEHIEEYTIPQYGDKGEDNATDYTVQDCITQIKRYVNRAGKNSRPGQESLDLIKIAHYAQMAYTLIGEQDAKK
jgi:hypothetical protein